MASPAGATNRWCGKCSSSTATKATCKPVWPCLWRCRDTSRSTKRQRPNGSSPISVERPFLPECPLNAAVSRFLTQMGRSLPELLHRLQLWSAATEIIRICPLDEIRAINQKSTTVYTSCPGCGRPLFKTGWACEHCNTPTNTCSVWCDETCSVIQLVGKTKTDVNPPALYPPKPPNRQGHLRVVPGLRTRWPHPAHVRMVREEEAGSVPGRLRPPVHGTRFCRHDGRLIAIVAPLFGSSGAEAHNLLMYMHLQTITMLSNTHGHVVARLI